MFGSPARRVRFRDKLEAADVRYCFVELSAADETVRQRLAGRGEDEPVISDARLEDYPRLSTAFHPPDALEQWRCFRVHTDRPLSQTALAVLNGVIRLQPLMT